MENTQQLCGKAWGIYETTPTEALAIFESCIQKYNYGEAWKGAAYYDKNKKSNFDKAI